MHTMLKYQTMEVARVVEYSWTKAIQAELKDTAQGWGKHQQYGAMVARTEEGFQLSGTHTQAINHT